VQALEPDLDEVLRELAAPTGGFDGVVVSVASWGSIGRAGALDPTDEQWTELIDGNLTAVFRLFRSLTPLVRPGGAILQLNGMSADIPFPGSAGVALAAAATKSLVRTLAAELQGRGPRVYEVLLGVVRTRARQTAGIDNRAWLDGEQIGGHVAQLVAGTSPLAGTTLQYLLDAAAGPQPGSDGF
jgi:NAD(P)-dependent dehydrogenase (short-subunit alcohol dehydrogenase family)